MKNKILLLLSLCAAIVFTACNRGGKTGLLIPKDASFVIHVDFSSLSSKLSWKEIQQTAWYAEAQKKADDSLTKKLLADPASSGVDTDGSLVIFMKRANISSYVAVEGKLKDAEKFKKTIIESGKNNVKIEKDGDLNFARIENNDNGTVYFSDKMFVFIADASDGNSVLPNQSMPQISGSSQKYSIDSLKFFAKNIFSLKGKDLLDSDKRFADLMDNKADMHYWVNTESFYGGMMGGAMAMMKIGDVLAGNVSTGTANFENGKIIMESKQYYGEKLAELFKKYSGKNVSDELLSKLPDQNVLAAFAMNYSPEGIKEFLKLLGVDGLVNAAMAQFGYSVDDFVKANAGELAFALTDFSIKKRPASMTLENGETISYENEKPEIKFVFGTAVNDKAAFQKLIDVIGKNLKSQLGVPADTTISSDFQFKKMLQDKWFAFGSSDAEVNAFLSGNKKPAYSGIFSGHNGGGYIDLQKVIATVAANSGDSSSRKLTDISAAFWKNVNMFWDVKGDNATSKFEINLADGNTNALKQLNKYADQMYQAAPKSEMTEIYPSEMPAIVDTIAAPSLP